jgi:uncharacterized protein (TIGR02145 family)
MNPFNHKKLALPLAAAVVIGVFCLSGCGKSGKTPGQDAAASGGTYSFGDEGPSGTALIYPLTDSSALFYIDLSLGAPSYNSGSMSGQMAIKGSIGKYVLKDEDFDCILNFKFSSQKLDITTESGHDNCGFGGNVYADNSYKQLDKPIPEYFIDIQGDTVFFEMDGKFFVKREPQPESEPAPVTHETFTDTRDGKTYRAAKMPDGKTWMAENLNYAADSSWCYENSAGNCAKYGRLYAWNAAAKACPNGWHLPSVGEWDGLSQAVGSKREEEVDGEGMSEFYWQGAGKKLKAKSGYDESGNGTDDYGFSALPGGNGFSDGSFSLVGLYGYWWTSEEYDSDYAYNRTMTYYSNHLIEGGYYKSVGTSVRCVRD